MMFKWVCFFVATCNITFGRPAPEDVQALVVKEKLTDRKVTVLKLGLHFVTVIQVPETINSIVIGDPALFKVEHSEKEPQLVFVRPMTQEVAQTNLLVTTVGGRRISLLLKAGPDELGQATSRKVHFLLQYESSNRLVIDQASDSSLMIPETVALPSDFSKRLPKRSLSQPPPETSSNLLERLLSRQRRNPLPSLRGNSFRAGISEVFENGPYLSVLFSIVNPGKDRIELMPPQVQLSGAKRSAGIFRRSHPYISEQVAVSDFRLSSRNAEANERVDGVALFEKPLFKESDQSLLLQISTWGAVDRPVLVPIPLGMTHFTEGEFQ